MARDNELSNYLIAPDPTAVRLTRNVSGVDHTGAEVAINVVEERPLTIFLNRQEIVTAMTIGDYPAYLALGFLRNQGMLRPDEEITGVDLVEWQLLVASDLPLPLKQDEIEMSGWAMGVTLGVSLVLGIGIFFILPLLLVKFLDSSIASDLLSNVVEGFLRLAILLGYIWGVGFIKDIRRVYAYHGAEHMAVHAHEAGLPLSVANVRKFGTPHPRCGTAFLLTVVLVSIVIFAFLGRPDFEWRVLSRIVLLPVVAGISYEIIRFSGAHQKWSIAQAVAWPCLLLQRLTTRQPDDAQIEVAITAMESAIAADAGQEYVACFPLRNILGEAGGAVESVSE